MFRRVSAVFWKNYEASLDILLAPYDFFWFLKQNGESFRSVVTNVQDCDIVVSEFELQLHNHTLFRTHTCLRVEL